MITANEIKEARKKVAGIFEKANIVLTAAEQSSIEISDFGLSDLQNIGLQLVVYVNTSRVCAKEMVLLPWQTCPEHSHPNISGTPGKEETFRCRAGMVYLYVDKEPNCSPQLHGLDDYKQYLQVSHEIILLPGEQYTLPPNLRHWFRAGKDGAVISEFSTQSIDELDIFTDPRVERITKVTS